MTDNSDIGVLAHRFYLSRDGKLVLVHTVTESDPVIAETKHRELMREAGYDVDKYDTEVHQLNNLEKPL